MDVDSDSGSSSNVDSDQVIDIVEIGKLDLPCSQLVFTPGMTYGDLDAQLNQLKPKHDLVVLVQKFGPYPVFIYSFPLETIPSSTRRAFVFDRAEYDVLVVVRTTDEDVVLPLALSYEDDRSPTIDVITSHTRAHGYSPLSVKDYAGRPFIKSQILRDTIRSSWGAYPTIAFVKMISGYDFQTDFKNDLPVSESLKFLLARGEALVQRVSSIPNDDLRPVHLARALVHLIVSVQKVDTSSNASEAADYCSDLHQVLDRLEDFIEVENNSEETVLRVFDELCEDRPGAVAVRQSYEAFLNLGRVSGPPDQAYQNIDRFTAWPSRPQEANQSRMSDPLTYSKQDYDLDDEAPITEAYWSDADSRVSSASGVSVEPLEKTGDSSKSRGRNFTRNIRRKSSQYDAYPELILSPSSSSEHDSSYQVETQYRQKFPPASSASLPSWRKNSADKEDVYSSPVPTDITPTTKPLIDEYLLRYLNYLCIHPDAKDRMGHTIHQMYTARRIQRYEQLYGWLPLKFRIEAFVNGFIDLLTARGLPQDVIVGIPGYLDNSKLFSRLNESGNRMKSQGQTIWRVRARPTNLAVEASGVKSVTMPLTEGQTQPQGTRQLSHRPSSASVDPPSSFSPALQGDISELMMCPDPLLWEFLPYERSIVGQPPLAIVGTAWQWNLKIHDHWTRRKNIDWNILPSPATESIERNQNPNLSTNSSLPNWLSLVGSKLKGTPMHPGAYPITLEATFQEDHSPEPIAVRGSFTINVSRSIGGWKDPAIRDAIIDGVDESCS
ncbi:hypothetical protein FRC15_009625 [Serendipita sp. 397]|nr:hypothetical protein FRC15_009625 [Serendipita sp. 397]